MKKNVIWSSIFLTTALLVGAILLNASFTGEPAKKDVSWSIDDFAEMRIENEDKLDVPPEKVDEVWNYMVARLVDDKSFLLSLDSILTSYWNDELFIDEYFDTPELIMLDRKSGVRHRTRYNLTDTTSRKHGRQLMQVKINNIDGNAMNRGELKYKIEYPASIKTADDVHPVLRRIKDDERIEFKKVMAEIGVDPYSLKPILTNTQRRRSLYIPRGGEQFISIRLDECASEMLFWDWKHVELEPELNELPYTAADSAGRAFMEGINQRIVDDILQQFPEIKRDLTPKYNKAFNYFDKKIPLLRFWISTGFL